MNLRRHTTASKCEFALVAAFALVSPATLPAQQDGDGGKQLFNGKDLCDWDGDPRSWRIDNGEIVGETTAANPAEQNTLLIHRGGEFSGFDLRFQYRVSNSIRDRPCRSGSQIW